VPTMPRVSSALVRCDLMPKQRMFPAGVPSGIGSDVTSAAAQWTRRSGAAPAGALGTGRTTDVACGGGGGADAARRGTTGLGLALGPPIWLGSLRAPVMLLLWAFADPRLSSRHMPAATMHVVEPAALNFALITPYPLVESAPKPCGNIAKGRAPASHYFTARSLSKFVRSSPRASYFRIFLNVTEC
jgi:hypothetical protein